LATLGRFRQEWPQIALGQDRAAGALSGTSEHGDLCVEYALAICSGELPNHGMSLTIQVRWLQQAIETPAGLKTTHRGRLLFNLGRRLNRIHAYADAKQHLDECLPLGDNDAEPFREAILCELGNTYAGLGEHARGIALLEAGLDTARKEGRYDGFMLVSLALIRTLVSQEEAGRACALLESARTMCRARSDITSEGLLLGAISVTLQQAPGLNEIVDRRRIERYVQEYTEQLRSSRDAASSAQDTPSDGDRSDRPDPFQLKIAVSMLQSIGGFEAALDLINKALVQVDKDQEPDLELEILLQAGEVFKSAGQDAPARRVYERALRLAESLNHKAHQARILSELAEVQEWRREYTTAIAYRNSSIASQREVGTADDEFENFMAQGLDSSSSGDYERAGEYFAKAAVVARGRGSVTAELDALAILGTMQSRFKQYDKARIHLERALACIEELRVSADSTERAHSEHHLLQMLGTTFFGQRDYQKAILYLKRSQKTAHAIGTSSAEAVKNAGVYLLLAEAFWFTRRRGKAAIAIGGIVVWCGIALLRTLCRPVFRIIRAYRDRRLFWRWHHADVPGKPAGELFERPAAWVFVLGAAGLIPVIWAMLTSPARFTLGYGLVIICFIGLGRIMGENYGRKAIPRGYGCMIS
jgi:tetratricopeptide (TPR) repeat protein